MKELEEQIDHHKDSKMDHRVMSSLCDRLIWLREGRNKKWSDIYEIQFSYNSSKSNISLVVRVSKYLSSPIYEFVCTLDFEERKVMWTSKKR